MTNFWDALELFKTEYSPPSPIEYRLYYANDGSPLFYTTDTSIRGQYIIIDKNTYQDGDYLNVKVVNGVLKIKKASDIRKLIPSNDHGTPCHSDDITVIMTDNFDKNITRWNARDYEYR